MNILMKVTDIFLKVLYHTENNGWIFRLWKYSVRTHARFLYLSIIFAFIELYFSIVKPVAFGKLSQILTKKNADYFDNINHKLIPIITTLTLSKLMGIILDAYKSLFSLNFRNNLRKEYYESLLSKDLEFFGNHKLSELFYILTHDIQKVGHIAVLGLIKVFKKLVHCIIAIVMLFYISTKLALFLCVVIPLIAILETMKNNLIMREEKKYSSQKKNSHNMVLEALDNMKIIKSFSTEDKEKKKYEKKLKTMFDIEYYTEISIGFYQGSALFLLAITIFYGIKYGLYLVRGNELTLEILVSFFLYCKTILDCFQDLNDFSRNFHKASIIAVKLFYILDYVPNINSYYPKMLTDNNKNSNNNIGIKKKITGKITLKNVYFEYPSHLENEVNLIKNINLEIYPGMKLGIVGLSGSGKSTLIDLIERLYDVGIKEKKNDEFYLEDQDNLSNSSESNEDEKNNKPKHTLKDLKNYIKPKNKKNYSKKLKNSNKNSNNSSNQESKKSNPSLDSEILFDDINVKNYDLKSLHSQIGYVPQEPSLFNDSILENLLYGLDIENQNKNNYEKEIKWSLHTTQANFVFDEELFPLGLQTIVGDRGAKLSGGQKQRIAIARALIKKPKILILDEATSALDSESEYKFQQELKELKGNMTIIIASHRLCTIKDCDQIIVINKGSIIETGTHDELIEKKGIYYNLMENQLLET